MQNTIQIGQVQPSVLSKVEAAVKSMRARFDRKVEESEFCQVLGIMPWHFTLDGMKVTAAVFLFIVVVCGMAEWLERW